MKIKVQRVLKNLEELNKFNSTPEKGCTRFSYTFEDQEAKKFLIQKMKNIGMTVWYDGIGNLHGKLEGSGKDKKVVVSGSHIDTVPGGGKYDGNLGVIGALEAAKTIVENQLPLYHDYEIIVFVEEEGAHFGTNLIGSKAIAGKFNVENTKSIKDSSGETMYELMKKAGFVPEEIYKTKIEPEALKAMVELHIEQGRVLDTEKKSVGIVKGIVGLRWIQIEICGESNHAGATPMSYRKDPLVEAAKFIGNLPEMVKRYGDSSVVATVGKIQSLPNQTNVIPEKIQFTVDLRGIDEENLDLLEDKMKRELEEVAAKGFTYSIQKLAYAKAVKSDEKILEIIRKSAEYENFDYQEMYSGANHDTSLIGELTDVAMIFVPSIDGRSHCCEEFTEAEDIEKGCQLLFKTVYQLCQI